MLKSHKPCIAIHFVVSNTLSVGERKGGREIGRDGSVVNSLKHDKAPTIVFFFLFIKNGILCIRGE